MTKTELARILYETGLKPSDLQDDYDKMRARDKLLEKARSQAAYHLIAYIFQLLSIPGSPSGEDIKDFTEALKEKEDDIKALFTKRAAAPSNETLDAIARWAKAFD